MKHMGKNWYTCDRCGKDFDLLPRDVAKRILTWRKNKPLITCMTTADLSGYVSKTELLGDVV